MENESTTGVLIKDAHLDDFIPIINNGYFLLLDRSDRQSEDSKSKYELRNYSIFLLDIDENTLYYIGSDM